jgi:arylsulfatase A-like enzyme
MRNVDLEKIGEMDDTLIVVTADHGHGFVSNITPRSLPILTITQDVFGSADTKYLSAQTTDTEKRRAGTSIMILMVHMTDFSCSWHVPSVWTERIHGRSRNFAWERHDCDWRSGTQFPCTVGF